MILTKLLLVLVLVNPSLLSKLRPSFEKGSIDKRFHEDELTKILNEKNPQEFKYISHRGKIGKIPRNFDARTKWPMCKCIDLVIDQGGYTINWAIAPLLVTNDRSCIARRGKELIPLSFIDLVRCCDSCRLYHGLKKLSETKSNLITTFFFMKRVGVVNDNCISSWSNSALTLEKPCKEHCESNQGPYVKFKFSNILIGTNLRRGFKVIDMQAEIKKNGPIAGMIRGIPKDFLHNYTDEVYISNGKNLIEDSAHAIKILGWGVENKVRYWLCANSWGIYWGKLGGYFKIRRGKNELGIEEFVIAPDPSNETADNIFNPAGEIKNSISCTKTTELYIITAMIVLIIFSL